MACCSVTVTLFSIFSIRDVTFALKFKKSQELSVLELTLGRTNEFFHLLWKVSLMELWLR